MRKFTEFIGVKKISRDEEFMDLALKVAEISKSKGDSPIGAVLALPNKHLAEGDSSFSENDPLGRATINVLRKAAQTMPYQSLKEAVLYLTKEPCAMCALAASRYGIREIVFGVYDNKDGFVSSPKAINLELYDIVYRGGVLAESCYNILSKSLKEHTTEKPNETHASSDSPGN